MRLFGLLAPAVGALITVMCGINSALSLKVGALYAILFIHCAGFVAVSAFCAARRNEPRRDGRAPAYLYLAGCVGVGTVFGTNMAFNALGASLAVALALLGQTLFSLAVDATGFLGRRRYPLSARRLPVLAMVLAGIACMAGRGTSGLSAVAVLLGLAAGVSNGLNSILNAELGLRIGLARSTRINYIAGLATTVALIAVLRPPLEGLPRSAAEAGPLLLAGGGFLGVVVVASSSYIYPRIPAFSATLLVFAGQALAGLAFDFIALGRLDASKALGIGLVVAGLGLDAARARRESRSGGGTAEQA